MMQKLKMNKRGISPIIATLLLIAIAVAAAVVTYSWVMSMLATEAAQSETSIKIDFVQFVSSTEVDVTVRNAGTIPATISTIYITATASTPQVVNTLPFNGNSSTVVTTKENTNTTMLGTLVGCFIDLGSKVVPVGQTVVFKCMVSGITFTSGDPYQIEVMTNTGFSTTGTYYA
jgi:flagellin-like protein